MKKSAKITITIRKGSMRAGDYPSGNYVAFLFK